MTRVILWKEMREQAHVAVTLVVLAVFVILGAKGLLPSKDVVEVAIGLAGLFAWAFGLVSGSQLLAGERENGTQAWLDTLPVARLQLGRRKALAGVVLTLAQAVLLWIVLVLVLEQAFFFGRGYGPNFAIVLLMMSVVAVCGLAGGLFGSAVARSTLGAVGWGILAQSIAIPTALFFGGALLRGALGAILWGPLTFSLVMLLPAALRYTSLDRRRQRSTRMLTAAGPGMRRVLLWLAWRQGRSVYWFLLLTGVALAVIVPATSPLAWPLAGALFGVIAGLMAFGPEQPATAYRMVGDRRLPVGSIWVWKLAGPITVVAVAVALLAANLFVHYIVEVANPTNAMDAIRRNSVWLRSGLSFATLVLGPLYGFACGQFFGLIYRKAVVAAVMALATSLGAVLLWLPSITLGGLDVWQWLAPPVVLLVASRLAMWPWVAGRIGNLRTVAALVAACLLAVLTQAAGVAYRAVELPAPAAFDQRAAQRDLFAEYTDGARCVGQAIGEFAAHLPRVEAKLGPPVEGGGAPGGAPPAGAAGIGQGLPAPPGVPHRIIPAIGANLRPDAAAAAEPSEPSEPPRNWDTRAIDAIDNGWPDRDEVLRSWLDELARGDWWATLKSAVGQRAGASPDPNGLDSATIEHARRLGLMLAARSLQLQKQGDYEAALEPLEMALTLTANLQSFANGHQLSVALVVQRQALGVLGEWTRGVGAHPDLLRRALAAVRAIDRGQSPMQMVVDVEFYRALRTAPPPWQYDGARNDVERTLVPFAGAVVWEAERYGRFVEAVREGYVRYAALDFRTAAAAFESNSRQNDPNLGQAILWRWVGPTGLVASRDETGQSLIEFINRSPWLKDAPMVFVPELSQWYNVRTQLQGSIIRLALMLYQCDHNRLPESLEALVPDYLKALPADPYNGGSFRYRISSGERLLLFPNVEESKAYRDVPGGAAVVWSVGADLGDDGGRIQQLRDGYTPTMQESDVLFIVPRVSRP